MNEIINVKLCYKLQTAVELHYLSGWKSEKYYSMENILKNGSGTGAKSRRLRALVALSEGLFGC